MITKSQTGVSAYQTLTKPLSSVTSKGCIQTAHTSNASRSRKSISGRLT